MLRKHYRNLRKELSEDLREYYAKAATQHLLAEPSFKQSQHIACYLSVNSEIDPYFLIASIWNAGKHCYLPVLSAEQDGRLQFIHYDAQDALAPNQYNILEPVNRLKQVALQDLDMIIMPLVSFDDHGHRLGTGGGFYDKTFALLDKDAKKPLRVGLAYSIQHADNLPHDDWDVNLHAVVTEEGFKLF